MKNYLGKKLFSISFYPLLFLGALWFIYFIQQNSNFNFSKFGVLPRKIEGLHGVITSVMVHGGLDHILSNSFPLLILGMILFFFYGRIAKPVFFWIWLISGLWLWIGGRNYDDHPVYHIGASTLIYGLATFLFFSGVFRRHLRLMVVSALVVFLYGSMMYGIFPFQQEISWEGHLFGALAGVLVAYNYKKEGPQRKVYEWENEIEEEADSGENENEPETTDQGEQIRINYIYKEKDKDPLQ